MLGTPCCSTTQATMLLLLREAMEVETQPPLDDCLWCVTHQTSHFCLNPHLFSTPSAHHNIFCISLKAREKNCALRRPGIQRLKNSLTWPDLILLQSLSLSLFLSFSRFLSPATSSVLSSFSSPSIHLFTSQIRCARIVSTK